MTDRRGAQNFGYDTLDRLTSATHPLTLDQTYSYDPVGNRLNDTSQHNAANQLTEDASFTYQYDANGNLVRKTVKANANHTDFNYDAENRLVKVEEFAAGATTPAFVSTYRYDGLGRRIEKIGNGITRRHVYDREDILLEYEENNALLARYTHGRDVDEPVAVRRGGTDYFYHADGLGSITEVTGSIGDTAKTYAYDSWGNILEQSGTAENPYTFTGREFDSETGLYYYRTRYYDPQAGRFIQRDPAGFAGGDINLFAYVGSDPVTYIDPRGLLRADPNDRVRRSQNTIVCYNNQVEVHVLIENFSSLEVRCGVFNCIVRHEEIHRNYARSQRPDICLGKPDFTKVTTSDPEEYYRGEIEAYNGTVNCMVEFTKKNEDPCCEEFIAKNIDYFERTKNRLEEQLRNYLRQQGRSR